MNPLDRQARDLHGALSRLTQRCQVRDRDEICCHGISVTQCHALDALCREGDLPMGSLARALHVKESSTTRAIDPLVAGGLVERREDPGDRRRCLISITPKGRTLIQCIHDEMIERERDILSGLDPQERETVVSSVRRLAEAIDTWHERQTGSTVHWRK